MQRKCCIERTRHSVQSSACQRIALQQRRPIRLARHRVCLSVGQAQPRRRLATKHRIHHRDLNQPSLPTMSSKAKRHRTIRQRRPPSVCHRTAVCLSKFCQAQPPRPHQRRNILLPLLHYHYYHYYHYYYYYSLYY